MIATVLLFVFLALIFFDILQGLRRGFFPSLLRLLSVVAVVVLAFFTAEYIGDHIMELELTYERSVYTVEEIIVLYIEEFELEEALNYSETIKQLVMHMPEILVKEILFVPLFFIYKLLSLPIIGIVNNILFRARKKKRDGTVVRRKKHRFSGMLVGAAQGILCFAVLMVPVFGMLDFSASFSDSFEESESYELISAAAKIESDFIIPLENATWVKTLELCGVRAMCTASFDALSKTELVRDGETHSIYYFETLEEAFPAINAFVVLQDIDPEHMTSDDYKKLNYVFVTAKDSEEVSTVITEVTTSLVSNYVDDHYKESADAITEVFLNEVLAEHTDTEKVDFEAELGAIQTILEVIDSATAEDTEHAFNNHDIDVVVDTILSSDVTYATIMKVIENEDTAEILRAEIDMGESMKAQTEDLLNTYRAEQLETASVEEIARILEATDSIAELLGVSLAEIPNF